MACQQEHILAHCTQKGGNYQSDMKGYDPCTSKEYRTLTYLQYKAKARCRGFPDCSHSMGNLPFVLVTFSWNFRDFPIAWKIPSCSYITIEAHYGQSTLVLTSSPDECTVSDCFVVTYDLHQRIETEIIQRTMTHTLYKDKKYSLVRRLDSTQHRVSESVGC